MNRLSETVRAWRVEAASQGRPLRLPVMPFLLRNIWTGALLFFSLLMFSTFFITTVFQVILASDGLLNFGTNCLVQATVLISFVGICWAVAMWVPFSIIMEVRIHCFLPLSLSDTISVAERRRHTSNSTHLRLGKKARSWTEYVFPRSSAAP